MSRLKLRVLTGCQMDGLVCALRILFPLADVAGFHTYKLLGEEGDDILADVRAADILFALPLHAPFGELAADRIHRLGPTIQFVPHVVFAAFHPDITYLERLDGSRVQTPMTDYHSLIAVAAYLAGLEREQTLSLYNAYVFQALGYFSLLEASKASLLADFDARGIDLREALGRWLEHPEAFMYSMNHPKPFVLADLAVAASRAVGLWDEESAPDFSSMPDHLGQWVVYPVFDEIGARLGRPGHRRFKMIGDNFLTLDAFVARSFESYAAENTTRWELTPRIATAQAALTRLAARSLGAWRPTRADAVASLA